MAKRTQGPLAEALWAAAAEAAREHGVFRASKVMGLEYDKLKRMAEADGVALRPSGTGSTFGTGAAQSIDRAECVLELEGPRGKMRIQWKGTTAPDLPGLSRVLWESA